MTQETDILIVGGGVAGAAAALALKDTPFSITLVEPRKGHDVNRGDVLYPASLEILSELGALPYIYRKQPIPYDKEYIFHNDKEILTFDWSIVNDRFPFAFSIDHGAIEESILDAAYKDQLTILRGSVVTSLLPDTTGVTAVITGNGKDETIRAKFVIGADGRNSLVRKTLGITITPKKFAKDAIIFWMPINQTSDEIVKFYAKPPECVLTQLLPPGNRLRVAIGVSIEEKETWHKKTNEEKHTYLRSFSKNFDHVDPIFNDEHIYTTQSHSAPSYGRDRMVLVGDAAHEIHPVSSQGIGLAIGDVYVLARLLKKTNLEDMASLVTQYETIRKPVVETVRKHSDIIADSLFDTYPGSKTVEELAVFLLEHSEKLREVFAKALTNFEYAEIGHQQTDLSS